MKDEKLLKGYETLFVFALWPTRNVANLLLEEPNC